MSQYKDHRAVREYPLSHTLMSPLHDLFGSQTNKSFHIWTAPSQNGALNVSFFTRVLVWQLDVDASYIFHPKFFAPLVVLEKVLVFLCFFSFPRKTGMSFVTLSSACSSQRGARGSTVAADWRLLISRLTIALTLILFSICRSRRFPTGSPRRPPTDRPPNLVGFLSCGDVF